MADFVRSLGLLYGLNTLGGAAGVFLAGFFLFEWVGISASAYVAAAVQGAVGLIALLVDRVSRESAPRGSSAGDRTPSRGSSIGSRERLACLIAACAGGGAVLGYEVIWTRLLSLMMRSFSYSFSLMLSLFLVGLCVGAILLAVRVRDRVRPAVAVGWLQLAMGVYVALSLLWLPEALAPVTGATSFSGFLLGSVLRAAPVVLPPTILSGMVLPLAARGFTPHAGNVARDVGLVYALNTAGAIAGALIAGLLLLPTLGAPTSLVVLAILNAAAGAVAVFLASRRTAARVTAVGLLLVCAVPLSLGGERFVEAFLRATRSFDKIGEVLFFRESATDTIAIVRKDYGFHDPEAKSLITNGVAMSATVKPVWRYMALEGHLPVLFGAQTNRALAVGVGTGITLGAVVSHPEVQAIDAIELSPGVAEGLGYFEAENGLAHLDPRVTPAGRGRAASPGALGREVRHRDARATAPDRRGLRAPLFVRLLPAALPETARRRRRRPVATASLAESAVGTDDREDLRGCVSVRDALAAVGARRGDDRIGGAVAGWSSTPCSRPTPSRGREAIVDRAYLESPEALLATFLVGREGLAGWAGDAPRITDEHPHMEFFRNQGRNMRDRDWGALLDVPRTGWGWIGGIDGDPALLARVEHENRALRSYLHGKTEENPRLEARAATSSRGTEFFLYGFGCASAQARNLGALGADDAMLRRHAARCAPFRTGSVDSP